MEPLVGDALDELQEIGVLGLKPVVKALGDPLDIEARPGPAGDIGKGDVFFFLKGNIELLKFLEKRVARLALGVSVLPTGQRLAGLFLDPLPDLDGAGRVPEDDEVLVDALGGLPLDPAAHRIGRHSLTGRGRMEQDGEAPLLRHPFHPVRFAVHGNIEGLTVMVPAQVLDEEVLKIESLEMAAGAGEGERHGRSATRRFSAIRGGGFLHYDLIRRDGDDAPFLQDHDRQAVAFMLGDGLGHGLFKGLEGQQWYGRGWRG